MAMGRFTGSDESLCLGNVFGKGFLGFGFGEKVMDV